MYEQQRAYQISISTVKAPLKMNKTTTCNKCEMKSYGKCYDAAVVTTQKNLNTNVEKQICNIDIPKLFAMECNIVTDSSQTYAIQIRLLRLYC